MMHVALVHRDLHQLTRGGICTVYRALAAHLAARGARVTLITQTTPHPVHLPNVAVETLPRTEDLTAHRHAVAEVLDRIQPDVAECSSWEAELLGYVSRPARDRAPVLVRAEFSAATLGANDLALGERVLLHKADHAIAVSRYAAEDLREAYGIPRPDVIYNGIDRARFRSRPLSLPTSGYRVTLDSDGRPTAPEPLPRLLAEGQTVPPWSPDSRGRIRLIWIGKITAMKGWDRLEQIARKLIDLAAITVVLGHSPALVPVTIDPSQLTILHDLDDADLPSLYRNADWLLSTSRWEGFGLAIAEALACGTPVLLPEKLGTASELLIGGGGYTYRNADHLRAILTCQPRPHATLPAHFSWPSNAAATLAIYRELVDKRVALCAS
jgi:D-inositol-3-phosphate glycosyltransferase